MSRRYTEEEKADALECLRVYDGNITTAHVFTGIPERTLRDWRRAATRAGKLSPEKNSRRRRQQAQLSGGVTYDDLRMIRNRTIDTINLIFDTPVEDPDLQVDHAKAVVRLLDLVLKLDKHLPNTPLHNRSPITRAHTESEAEDSDVEYDHA